MFPGSETNIRLQHMTDDRDKTSYLSTYLKDGNPKTWYYAVKTHDESLLSNFDSFLSAFRSQFADPNYGRTALRQLKALRQTGSCASYATKFRSLLSHVSFSDQTKLDQFKEGLKPSIRDAIVLVRPKPAAFDDYVVLAIEIDNDLHESELADRERTQNARAKGSGSGSGSASNDCPSPDSIYSPGVYRVYCNQLFRSCSDGG
jgi:hypothetical protein